MKDRSSVRQLSVCALMTAVMCVIGPLAVPVGVIPVSLGTFVIYLAAFLLGAKGAVVSCAVYLALGLAGLPVFTNFQGGIAKVAGPTGGYMVGYLFLAWIGGWAAERFGRKTLPTAAGMAVSTLVLYAFGTAWFLIITHTALWYALTQCVLPFIVFDGVKIVLAIVLGRAVRLGLTRAKLLREDKDYRSSGEY